MKNVYVKQKILFILISICLLLLFPTSQLKAEPQLWEIYNTIYENTHVGSNQDLTDNYGVSYDEMWLFTNGYVIASARFAGYKQRFGYYADDCSGNERVELFNVTESGYLNQGKYERLLIAESADVVGFYVEPYTNVPKGLWFSQYTLNSDNSDHMRAYRAPEPDFNPANPEYLIGWEDLENLGDADYNDLIVTIRSFEPYRIECCKEASECDDGIYCNGVETCTNSACQQGSDPCPDDGMFCNGTEGCDEEGNTCTSSGDPCGTDLRCDEQGSQCVGCLEDEDCNDGTYCNGEESCSTKVCVHAGNPCSSDTTCNEEAQSCDQISTTTTTVVPAPPPPPVVDNVVVVVPEVAEVNSGGSLQFYAVTIHEGRVVKGNCEWKIVSDAGIGSAIDSNGLYNAGTNLKDGPVTEKIKVVDLTYGYFTYAKVTIHALKISITQDKEVVNSGEAVRFGALTALDGSVIENSYQWEIDPPSTIGSSISSDGTYVAGMNLNGSDVMEAVKVTDVVYGISTSAAITVRYSYLPVPGDFEVTVTPLQGMVASEGTINFTAATTLPNSSGMEETNSPSYEWSVSSSIGSQIDAVTGLYKAGENEVGHQASDVITVVDHANGNTTKSAEVIVTYGKITCIFPSTILASRWLPLPYLCVITGEHLNIDPFYTLVHFEPEGDILPLSKFGFDDFMIVTILVQPNPVAHEVDIVLDNNGEYAVANNLPVTIDMLPWILDEKR